MAVNIILFRQKILKCCGQNSEWDIKAESHALGVPKSFVFDEDVAWANEAQVGDRGTDEPEGGRARNLAKACFLLQK